MRAFWWGFTLAEVLITLTIIGIIAALTIPSLMTKVQDHGFRSAFLKNYAVIQNAYQKSIRDGVPFYSGTDYWCINTAYSNDLNLIKDYFKVQKGPFYRNNGAGYWAMYDNFYKKHWPNSNQTFKFLNGTWATNDDFTRNDTGFSFQLIDGTILTFINMYRIIIDVNGVKGPNTFGKDIYILQAAQNIIYPFGAPRTGNAYKIHSNTESSDFSYHEVVKPGCAMDSDGWTCAYEILKNKSYKIPKS